MLGPLVFLEHSRLLLSPSLCTCCSFQHVLPPDIHSAQPFVLSSLYSFSLIFSLPMILYLFSFYLEGRQTQREWYRERDKKRARSSICWLTPPLSAISKVASGWLQSKLTGTPSGTSVWVAGTQVLISHLLPPITYIGRNLNWKQSRQDLNQALCYAMQVTFLF